MTEADFIACIRQNPINAAILDGVPDLGLPDAWLVSGSLFQTVWNHLTGRAPDHGIKDYDIFYFDPDTSYEAEDAQIRRVGQVLADLDAEIELRNQARVHLWYEDHFGVDYPPLRSSCEGIDRFLAVACKVGVSLDGKERLYAPDGLDDLTGMRVRPNPSGNFSAEHYTSKSARWHAMWPEVHVVPAAGG
ncbi:hypothetical protein GTQ45_10885 [Pyruvatibacter mobilis]|uniref:Nucleotidyltransferase family protein n=1 Tax=Pyruvatibacter mobilis TaxID=1712261 RepID=A0A845QCQ4_9HYPH|nr:nucleotidyltransferase family protein [Pyruvatibacter mobilis]NBG96237.1 hypothetical protein [Pyruvatibacter mobilis]QJD75738.1 nucleotidyltransferase family protein [Pyruvatibacter mobilis]GGD18150.1 hypothetical protein GCM10011587_23120 [Pyruvatibacter mobilis]